MGFFSLLGVITFASWASAFTLNMTSSELLGWDAQVLRFYVNATGCTITEDELNTSIDAAIELWNSVSTSGIGVERGYTSTFTAASAFAGDATDTPLIACDDNLSSTLGIETNNIPGVTRILTENLRVNYGVLLLNAESGKSAEISQISKTKLNVVIAHEIGHVLGLGHTSDENALMYYKATYKEDLALSLDDVDGITYLYPRSEPGDSNILGCATITDSEGDDPVNPMGAVVVAFWLLIVFLIARMNMGSLWSR